MAFKTGTATDYKDLLDQLRRYACGYGTWTTPTFTGTGNGTMTGVDSFPATVTETWTITCTDATTPGSEVWSVVGSVSGAKANATTGVAYDNALIKFTINAGGTNYVVTDYWTLAMTEGALTTAGEEWVEQRWTTGGEYELIMKGQGLAGTDEIYVGIQTYSNVPSDYYNWQLMGAIGYNGSLTFDNQPGTMPMGDTSGVFSYLWDSSIPYWFHVDGRRILMVAKVSTTYQPVYLGFIDPYALPGQYPYPLAVGGSGPSKAVRWSGTDTWMHAFIDPQLNGSASSLRLRLPDGTWQAFDDQTTARVWPHRYTGMAQSLISAPDGGYPVIPQVLAQETPANNRWGELRGVFYTPGYSQAAEDTISIGGDTYTVFQDTFRTANQNYFAIKQA